MDRKILRFGFGVTSKQERVAKVGVFLDATEVKGDGERCKCLKKALKGSEEGRKRRRVAPLVLTR
jgi:hypothetical protein